MKKGQKIKVKLERVPIYSNPGYVPSGKTTTRTIEIGEKTGSKSFTFTGVGWKRKRGRTSVPVIGRISMVYKDGGILYTDKAKYIFEIL